MMQASQTESERSRMMDGPRTSPGGCQDKLVSFELQKAKLFAICRNHVERRVRAVKNCLGPTIGCW